MWLFCIVLYRRACKGVNWFLIYHSVVLLEIYLCLLLISIEFIIVQMCVMTLTHVQAIFWVIYTFHPSSCNTRMQMCHAIGTRAHGRRGNIGTSAGREVHREPACVRGWAAWAVSGSSAHSTCLGNSCLHNFCSYQKFWASSHNFTMPGKLVVGVVGDLCREGKMREKYSLE